MSSGSDNLLHYSDQQRLGLVEGRLVLFRSKHSKVGSWCRNCFGNREDRVPVLLDDLISENVKEHLQSVVVKVVEGATVI